MGFTAWSSRRRGAAAGAALVVAAMLALVLALPAAPAAARSQQAPNSRVVLDLPPGYEPAEMFSGFQNETFGVSYVILEVPQKAYAEMAAGFTPQQLGSRGIREVELGRLQRSDEHVYMRGKQSSPAGDYAKFFVLFKTADLAVLVSANVPQKAVDTGAIKPEEVELVLASAAVAAKPTVRNIYSLGHLGPFKEAGSVAGTARLYTLDGRMEPARKGELRNAFIVAPSIDKAAVQNPPELAGRLLTTLSGFKSLKLGEPQKVVIAGLEGTLIEADGLHEPDDVPMRVMQVLLPGRLGGYFRMIGMAHAADADRLMPEFRRMAESFKPID